MLCTWVMCFVNLLQPLFHDVGINLRRGNIRMAQHQLNRAQIRAAFQQMRCKTVAQHVRSRTNTQSGLPTIRRENLPNTDAADGRSAAIDEKRCGESLLSFCRPTSGRASRKYLDPLRSMLFFPIGTMRSLSPLPIQRTHPTPVSRSITRRFTNSDNAQPRGIKHFQHRAIPAIPAASCHPAATATVRPHPGGDSPEACGESSAIPDSAKDRRKS